MRSFTLTTPVALLVFNRPEETSRVFKVIREARPEQLLVIADGPRSSRPGEAALCAEVRRIVGHVDWPCQVLFNYSDVNLGCKLRVSSGLDWVFSQVEEAIVLEDDCLPHLTFFRFCQEMLEKYRNNNRIASIGGTNYQFNSLNISESYYFSIYNHIWGWASWKRAWKDYDVDMKNWPSIRGTNWLSNYFVSKLDAYFWNVNFEKVYRGKIDTWDIQWTFACWLNNRLSIIPCENLVSNIGFGPEATHTKNGNCRVAHMAEMEINFPLIHPDNVDRTHGADEYTQKTIFRQSTVKTIADVLKYFLLGRK